MSAPLVEARAALAAGRPAEALALLAAFRGEPTVAALLLRGDALMALGQAEAEQAYRAALALSPREPEALLGIGHAARARGDPGAARDAFAAAHRAAPRSLKALDALMRAERAAGDWPAARASAAAALALAPGHLPALLLDAQAALALGDAAAARAGFEAAHRAAPTDLRPIDALLRLHQSSGAHRALAETAQIALVLAPLHVPARLALARLQGATGQFAEARATLAPIAEHPAARLEQARQLLGQGGPGALAAARALLAAHPEPRRAQRLLAHAAIDQGAFAEARAVLASITPADLETLLVLARLDWREGRPEAARARIAEAAARAPKNPRPLMAEARLARDSDRPAEAIALYQSALARDPQHAAALLGLPAALAAVGDFPAAAAAADAAEARLGPGPQLTLLRCAALRRQGLWPEALALARAEPEASFPILLERARLALLLEGPAVATEALAAASPQGAKQRADRLLLEALIAEESWDFEAAGAHFAEAAACQPQHAELRLNAARNALLRLDTEAARAHLRAAMAIRATPRRESGRSTNISQTHAGQILDELTLDPLLLVELQALRASPAKARLAPLAALLRDHPESTGAAMQILAAHRELAPLEAPLVPGIAPIPHRIAQFWTEVAPPAGIQALMASWPQHHAHATITRFDDSTALAFLRAHLPPAIAGAFRAAPEPAMRADLFRLAWLLVEGGLYADADDRCLAPLTPLLVPGRTLILYLEPWATAGNNFIAAIPGHPVIAEALQRAAAAVLRGDRDLLWLATGPGLMTRAIAGAIARRGGLPPGVALFDRPILHRHIAMHCFQSYKADARHWSQAAFNPAAARRY